MAGRGGWGAIADYMGGLGNSNALVQYLQMLPKAAQTAASGAWGPLAQGYEAIDAVDQQQRAAHPTYAKVSDALGLLTSAGPSVGMVRGVGYAKSAMQQPTKTMLNAYKDGESTARLAKESGMNPSYFRSGSNAPEVMRGFHYETDPVLHNFYAAGLSGSEVPSWVDGWRYGEIPSGGRSLNHRENVAEYGVSLMGVDGYKSSSDGTYELFNKGEHVPVSGWLVTHKTGSDGERMIVGAVKR